MDLVAWFGRFKTARAWAGVIAAINLVGIAYGFVYYRPQFEATPWYLWPFVPDSPLAVLWAELALLAYWLRWKPGVLDALAFVGNVQVGLWTTYVFIAYPSFRALDFLRGGEVTLNSVLLVGHLGMAALALIFVAGLRALPKARLAWAIGGAAAYYVLNDVLDYFGPTYPLRDPSRGPLHACADYGLRPYTVPCRDGAEASLAIATFLLTAFSVVALWALTRPREAV